MTTLDRNREIVRRLHLEVWSEGNLAAVDEICASDFVCHFPVGPEWHGPSGVKEVVSHHRASFPDWTEEVEAMIAEGDMVVTRFTSRGTHKGTFQGIPPTGRQVMISEICIFRLARGKIVEQWGSPDILGLLQQLGARVQVP